MTWKVPDTKRELQPLGVCAAQLTQGGGRNRVRSQQAFTRTHTHTHTGRQHRDLPAHTGRALLICPEGAVPHSFMLCVAFRQGQPLHSTSLVSTQQWVLSSVFSFFQPIPGRAVAIVPGPTLESLSRASGCINTHPTLGCGVSGLWSARIWFLFFPNKSFLKRWFSEYRNTQTAVQAYSSINPASPCSSWQNLSPLLLFLRLVLQEPLLQLLP